MDLFHQRLQRAPADFTKISVVVRHELLAVAGAVDADARPPQIAIRFAQAAIANERRFRSHRQASYRQSAEAAEGRDFMMDARIGMMRALNHGKPAVSRMVI